MASKKTPPASPEEGATPSEPNIPVQPVALQDEMDNVGHHGSRSS
ncbi:MAG: hypothetical protein RL688_499 [Actinomycetota bacterium]